MRQRIPTANELYFGDVTRDVAQLEALEKVFFKSVGLPNGTFKTTNHRRLDNLNALALPHLPSKRPLDVMDVAVSSGVSTVEWLESLEQAGIECRMTAGDAAVDAYLLSVSDRMRVLVNRQGRPLQYEVAGCGVTAPLRKRDRLKHFLPTAVMWTAGRMLRSTLSDNSRAAQGGKWGMHWRPLKLVSPSIRNRRHLDVVEDDILVNRSYVRCFDVLRAANILNLGYFDHATLTAMLTNLRERLRDGGTFIVCRTHADDVNHATIFGLDAQRNLRVLERLNDGSEIESIALSLPPGR